MAKGSAPKTSSSKSRKAKTPKTPRDPTSTPKPRGRPRKYPVGQEPYLKNKAPASNKGRGRPRKYPVGEEPYLKNKVNKNSSRRGRPRKNPPVEEQAPESQHKESDYKQPRHLTIEDGTQAGNPEHDNHSTHANQQRASRTPARTPAITSKNNPNMSTAPSSSSPASTDANEAHTAHARKHIAFLLANSPIYTHLLSGVTVVSASARTVTTRLQLQPHHLNSKGSLHGSVTATFVDFIGGVAIACSDLRDNTGVSTDIHVSYCGGAKAEETVEIEGIAEKVGGTLAFTRIVVRTVEGGGREGRLVAMGRHTKFVKGR